jgi:hypothetical protein
MKKHTIRLSLLVALLTLGSILVVKPASAQTVFNASNVRPYCWTQAGGLGAFFLNWVDALFGRTSYRIANKDVFGTSTRLTFDLLSTGGITRFRVRDLEWDFNFAYQMGGGGGADGLAFVVYRNVANIGFGGSGLGYMKAPCFAIEFDSYNNPELASSGWGTWQWMGSYYEMREDGIQAGLGDWGGTPIQTGGRTPFNVRGNHSVRITCRFTTDWRVNDPRRISVYVDGAASPQFSVVIPANYLCDNDGLGFFGITAGTGGLTDDMIILPDWSFQFFI